nr:Uridine-cytidine kinase 2 [Polyrhizophydium stewartii]
MRAAGGGLAAQLVLLLAHHIEDAARGLEVDGGRIGGAAIGVAGGGASGKAQVCQRIMETLAASGAVAGDRRRVSYIRLEDFYLPLGDDDVRRADAGEYNFDHPEALDLDLFLACLQSLSDGKPASIPRYDFQKKRRLPESVLIDPAPDVVVVSGILILYEREIRELIDLKVFVDVDSDVRLARQVIRDTEERYRMSLDQVLQRYVKFVKPSFEEFILPTKKFADVVIPRGETNTVAVELLTEHIVDILRDRGELTPDGVQGVLRSAAESGGIIAAAQTSEFAPIPQ